MHLEARLLEVEAFVELEVPLHFQEPEAFLLTAENAAGSFFLGQKTFSYPRQELDFY